MFHFDPPENAWKTLVFLCFQGDQGGMLGRKGLNNVHYFKKMRLPAWKKVKTISFCFVVDIVIDTKFDFLVNESLHLKLTYLQIKRNNVLNVEKKKHSFTMFFKIRIFKNLTLFTGKYFFWSLLKTPTQVFFLSKLPNF